MRTSTCYTPRKTVPVKTTIRNSATLNGAVISDPSCRPYSAASCAYVSRSRPGLQMLFANSGTLSGNEAPGEPDLCSAHLIVGSHPSDRRDSRRGWRAEHEDESGDGLSRRHSGLDQATADADVPGASTLWRRQLRELRTRWTPRRTRADYFKTTELHTCRATEATLLAASRTGPGPGHLSAWPTGRRQDTSAGRDAPAGRRWLALRHLRRTGSRGRSNGHRGAG